MYKSALKYSLLPTFLVIMFIVMMITMIIAMTIVMIMMMMMMITTMITMMITKTLCDNYDNYCNDDSPGGRYLKSLLDDSASRDSLLILPSTRLCACVSWRLA